MKRVSSFKRIINLVLCVMLIFSCLVFNGCSKEDLSIQDQLIGEWKHTVDLNKEEGISLIWESDILNVQEIRAIEITFVFQKEGDVYNGTYTLKPLGEEHKKLDDEINIKFTYEVKEVNNKKQLIFTPEGADSSTYTYDEMKSEEEKNAFIVNRIFFTLDNVRFAKEMSLKDKAPIALEFTLKGLLGIFVVIIVIISGITLLNKATNIKPKNTDNE